MQADSRPPPGSGSGSGSGLTPTHATYRGVARLSCQAGSVASDEAVLLIQPAGTLQHAAQSQTERGPSTGEQLMQANVCTGGKCLQGTVPERSLGLGHVALPNEPASVQTWRQTLNEHGRVMWRGQVTGHMSSLASNPAAWARGAA